MNEDNQKARIEKYGFLTTSYESRYFISYYIDRHNENKFQNMDLGRRYCFSTGIW